MYSTTLSYSALHFILSYFPCFGGLCCVFVTILSYLYLCLLVAIINSFYCCILAG